MNTTGNNTVPGASLLGLSVNIATWAGSPIEVKARLVHIDEDTGRTIDKFGKEYLLPANVNLIDIGQGDITYNTFTSRHEFSKHMAAQTQVKASGWGFSGEFDSAYSSLTEDGAASAYGLVDAQARLWSVSVEELQGHELDQLFAQELGALPDILTADSQQQFFDFFNKYGTHVVSTAIVGGRMHYLTAVSSSSNFDTETSKANIDLEYKSLFAHAGASAQADWANISKSWFASRKAELRVEGGDSSVLTAAVPPDDPNQPVNYSEVVEIWKTSINANPAVIGSHLQPLSYLAPVKKTKVLDAALDLYLNSSARARSTYQKVNLVGDFTCSISLGHKEVTPPQKLPEKLENMLWIVMADENGMVQFNQNMFADDRDQLDALIDLAEAASDGKQWWTMLVVILNHPPGPLSNKAMSWIDSCGVNLPDWMGYIDWPTQIVVTGKSNSPEFSGALGYEDYSALANRYMQYTQTMEASLPLYILS